MTILTSKVGRLIIVSGVTTNNILSLFFPFNFGHTHTLGGGGYGGFALTGVEHATPKYSLLLYAGEPLRQRRNCN